MRTVARAGLVLTLTAACLAVSGAVQTPTASAACANPTIDNAPVTGSVRVGTVLTANQGGSCAPLTTTSVTLQWERCTSATPTPADCTDIGSSATDSSSPFDASLPYTVVTADRNHFLRVRQTVDDVLADSTHHSATTLEVKGPPSATFTRTPSIVKRNEAVAFDAAGSTDLDGDLPLRYDWVWGDGTTSTNAGPTPSHSYATSGTKTVRLTVTDQDGETATTTRTVSVKFPPIASFVFGPRPVRVGQVTTFLSTSSDPENQALTYSWDLNGDGTFGDATTRTVRVTFRRAGSRTVALRVTADGETSTVFRTVVVEAALPPPTTPTTPPTPPTTPTLLEKIRPFPVVVIAGRFTRGGVVITRLLVRAPRGTRVRIVCKGKSCPRRVGRRRVGKSRRVRLRSYQKRMRAGTVIKIFVRQKGKIGKYTRFKMRRGAAPARRDRCLVPGKKAPVRCASVT